MKGTSFNTVTFRMHITCHAFNNYNIRNNFSQMSSLELYNYTDWRRKSIRKVTGPIFSIFQFPLVFNITNKLLLRKWNFLCSRNELRSILIIIFLNIRKWKEQRRLHFDRLSRMNACSNLPASLFCNPLVTL